MMRCGNFDGRQWTHWTFFNVLHSVSCYIWWRLVCPSPNPSDVQEGNQIPSWWELSGWDKDTWQHILPGGSSHNEICGEMRNRCSTECLIEGANWACFISCLELIGKSEKHLELYLQQMGKSQASGAVHKINGNCLVEVQYQTTNHFVANERKPCLRCHHL